MNPKLLATYFLGQIVGIASAGVAMFWSAGRLDWWPAWAVIAVWVLWYALVDIVILRHTPALMAERMSPPKGAKSWDSVLLSVLRLIELARYILAGLDQRYGWTGSFPLPAQITALVVCVLSTCLYAWAMASNPYFSQVVRIQADRGQTVATRGPYQVLRHPAYAGTIWFEVALSTLLGSWWAIIAGGLCAVLLILRTALEDRTLQAELAGYAEYTRQVRYRLLPGAW
jgi:protein-S-isoprenylcysteine O-methyltransferase Ste14